MMEKMLGIPRDKLLPNLAGESLGAWLKRYPLRGHLQDRPRRSRCFRPVS
jgi:hypothetical protein